MLSLSAAAILAGLAFYAASAAAGEASAHTDGFAASAAAAAGAATAPTASLQALREAVKGSAEEAETALGGATVAPDESGGKAAARRPPLKWRKRPRPRSPTGSSRPRRCDYADKAIETGQGIGDALVSGFRGAEDAVGEFVKTSKLGMCELVTSILADLANVSYRRFVLAPIANALGACSAASARPSPASCTPAASRADQRGSGSSPPSPRRRAAAACRGRRRAAAGRRARDPAARRADAFARRPAGLRARPGRWRRYESGAQAWVRGIVKPVAGTVRVARAGVEALSGWSVAATTGIVSFAFAPAPACSSPPASSSTCQCARHRPARRDLGLRPAWLDRLDPVRGARAMNSLSAALQAHLVDGTTTLAWVWRIERADGVVFGFTDHDRELTFGGVTYAAGLQPLVAAACTMKSSPGRSAAQTPSSSVSVRWPGTRPASAPPVQVSPPRVNQPAAKPASPDVVKLDHRSE